MTVGRVLQEDLGTIRLLHDFISKPVKSQPQSAESLLGVCEFCIAAVFACRFASWCRQNSCLHRFHRHTQLCVYERERERETERETKRDKERHIEGGRERDSELESGRDAERVRDEKDAQVLWALVRSSLCASQDPRALATSIFRLASANRWRRRNVRLVNHGRTHAVP